MIYLHLSILKHNFNPIKGIFKLCVCVCILVNSVPAEARGIRSPRADVASCKSQRTTCNMQESTLSFHHGGPRDQTEVLRLGNKHFTHWTISLAPKEYFFCFCFCCCCARIWIQSLDPARQSLCHPNSSPQRNRSIPPSCLRLESSR